MVMLIFLLFVSKSSGVVQTADKCAKKKKKIKITKQSSELSLESIGCEAFPQPVTQVRSSPVAQGKPLGDLLHCSRKATREVTGAWSISRSSAPMRYLGAFTVLRGRSIYSCGKGGDEMKNDGGAASL